MNGFNCNDVSIYSRTCLRPAQPKCQLRASLQGSSTVCNHRLCVPSAYINIDLHNERVYFILKPDYHHQQKAMTNLESLDTAALNNLLSIAAGDHVGFNARGDDHALGCCHGAIGCS